MNGQKKSVPTLRQTRRGHRHSAPPFGVQCILKSVSICTVLNAANAVPLEKRKASSLQHQRGQGTPFMQPTNSNGRTEGTGGGWIHQAGGRLVVQQPNRQQSAHLDSDMVAVHGPATNQRLGENFDSNRCTQYTTKLSFGVSSAPQIYCKPVFGVSSAPQSGILALSVVHPVQHTYYSHRYAFHFNQNTYHLVQEMHYPHPQEIHPDEMQHPEKNPAVCKLLENPKMRYLPHEANTSRKGMVPKSGALAEASYLDCEATFDGVSISGIDESGDSGFAPSPQSDSGLTVKELRCGT